MSIKFQLLIKTNIPTNKEVSALSLLDVALIMLINVNMPTIIDILIFMSRINFVLSRVEHKKVLYPWCQVCLFYCFYRTKFHLLNIFIQIYVYLCLFLNVFILFCNR